MSTATDKQFDQGLVNTIAAETQMSFIDGEKGVLEYVGIDIDSLARHSTFEESTFLLWNGRLPNAAELAGFETELRAEYALPEGLIAMKVWPQLLAAFLDSHWPSTAPPLSAPASISTQRERPAPLCPPKVAMAPPSSASPASVVQPPSLP